MSESEQIGVFDASGSFPSNDDIRDFEKYFAGISNGGGTMWERFTFPEVLKEPLLGQHYNKYILILDELENKA
jgi:hypothetical protein